MKEIVRPNKFAKDFSAVTVWTPVTGIFLFDIFILLNVYILICSGFHQGDKLYTSLYDNFGGATFKVVMPNISNSFAKVYTYPDQSKIRSGADFRAAHYLSQALNFNIQ